MKFIENLNEYKIEELKTRYKRLNYIFLALCMVLVILILIISNMEIGLLIERQKTKDICNLYNSQTEVNNGLIDTIAKLIQTTNNTELKEIEWINLTKFNCESKDLR